MSVVEERRQSKCAKLYREILQPRNISFGSTECLKTAANLNSKNKGNIKRDSCYVFDRAFIFLGLLQFQPILDPRVRPHFM